jgi:hypothetical protein
MSGSVLLPQVFLLVPCYNQFSFFLHVLYLLHLITTHVFIYRRKDMKNRGDTLELKPDGGLYGEVLAHKLSF